MKVLIQATHRHVRKHWPAYLAVGITFWGITLASFWVTVYYQTRFFPGITLDGVNISGLTQPQAQRLLNTFPITQSFPVIFTAGEVEVQTTTSDLHITRNTAPALEKAFQIGRTGSFPKRLTDILSGFLSTQTFESTYSFDTAKVDSVLQTVMQEVHQEGWEPRLELKRASDPNSLSFTQGQVGQELEVEKSHELIRGGTRYSPLSFELPIKIVGQILTNEQQTQFQEQAALLVGKKLTAEVDKKTFQFTDQQLIPTLQFPNTFNDQNIDALLESIREQVDREPANASFVFTPNTLEVTEFIPHRTGRTLNIEETRTNLEQTLQAVRQGDENTQFTIAFSEVEPDISLVDTNQLGITERIGFGESYYDHSIPSRIHNVSNAATRINNVIVKPGEEFSFNKALGEVSKKTGYLPAYVISGGQTVLGDGGGVCQVSTTLFRALLDSGLKITRRLPHSYRVSYYELNREPGFDATVYSGNVDLRFVNDTEHHLLLHFNADAKKKYMTVDIYGTSDGRTTEIKDYKKWNVRPAPAPVYFDDPTLPVGQTIQVDWAVGGIQTKFTHIVRDKEGNVISEKEYTSNYIPWSAKYRRGTGS